MNILHSYWTQKCKERATFIHSFIHPRGQNSMGKNTRLKPGLGPLGEILGPIKMGLAMKLNCIPIILSN